MGAYFLERIDHTGLYCHLQRVKIGDTCHWMFISAKCQVHFVKFGITKKLYSSMPLCILLLTINDVLNWYPILFCVDDVNQRCLLQPMLGEVPKKWKFFHDNFSWFLPLVVGPQSFSQQRNRTWGHHNGAHVLFVSKWSDQEYKIVSFFVTLHFSRDKSRKEVQLRLPITWPKRPPPPFPYILWTL